MSIDRDDKDDGARGSASQLIALAAASPGRAERTLDHAIADFFIPDDARLDERIRATLAATLAAIVALVEQDVRRRAAATLAAEGHPKRADRVAEGMPVLDRLIASGQLRDRELMRELLARTRQDLLADALPAIPADEAGAGSLLARLSNSGDAHVARAALALMAAESRRRTFLDTYRATQTELPAELHHRLVWWVAAAIREQVTGLNADRAIADAAPRALGAHDESDRVEATAMQLASAIAAQPVELPTLLIHALGERRVTLFIALLAHALGLDYTVARDAVVDGAAPLWLMLRAAELDRAAIARIGLSLHDADPRRDVHAFADLLDAIVAVTPDEARAALAPLKLHPDFRASISALEGPQ
ncbi:MAG: DUF2336 domain-containing protein [Pseudomonadota bacterium]